MVRAITTAATPYTARHPASPATTPANVRESRMPMSSPPISVPITLPRSASLASVAAYGTSICTTTEVIAGQRGRQGQDREVRRDARSRPG